MLELSKKHLKEANESYFQHMRAAIKISFEMLKGSLMAIMHSIIPSIFTTGTSEKIKDLYNIIEQRDKK